VEAGLQKDPDAWIGRTIRLKASVWPFPAPCRGLVRLACGSSYWLVKHSGLVDSLSSGSGSYTGRTIAAVDQEFSQPAPMSLLLYPEPDPLLASLRKVPWLGGLLPRPRPIFGGGTYRVRIQVARQGTQCLSQDCYWAILPDAASAPAAGGFVGR
jgi:hypothetical protein